MSRPIILTSRGNTRTTDDSGVTVIKSIIPNAIAGEYEQDPLVSPRRFVSSLAYFCIRVLVDTPELVHPIANFRISCTSERNRKTLRALTRHRGRWEDINWSRMDPRLWAVITQVFSDIPDPLRTYPHISLSDRHLSLLQEIPCTSYYSLITILVLANNPHVEDDNITQLRYLFSLCYLDLAFTRVSFYGIQRLSRTLDPETQQGPWALRALRMSSSRRSKDDAISSLCEFPLLSLVHLLSPGSELARNHSIPGFKPCPYRRLCENREPVGLLKDLASLLPSSLNGNAHDGIGFYSSSSTFSLCVDRLSYPAPAQEHTVTSAPLLRDDGFVVLPPLKRTVGAPVEVGAIKPGPAFLDQRQRDRAMERERVRKERRRMEIEEAYSDTEDPWVSDEEDPNWLSAHELMTSLPLLLDDPTSGAGIRPPTFISASAFFAKPKPEKKKGEGKVPPSLEPLVADPSSSNPGVLFRPPPPWSHVSAHIAKLLAVRTARQAYASAQSETMVPSVARRDAASRDVSGVLAMISKRRRVEEPHIFGGGRPPTSILNNPFRRQSMPGPALFPSDLHTPSPAPPTPLHVKPRASLPSPVFVSDFLSDPSPVHSCAANVPARAASPPSPPPLGKSTLKAAPQPERPMKPITSLPIPILPILDKTSRPTIRTPQPKSMNQARLDLQAGFAKPKPKPTVTSPEAAVPVLKPSDVGLTKKRERSDSAPRPLSANAPQKMIKPLNKALPVRGKQASMQSPQFSSTSMGKAVGGTFKAKAPSASKDRFNWDRWSKTPS